VNLAVTTLVCFVFFAREAAGASGTRHSPRPLFSEAVDFLGMTRALCVAGMRGCVCVWLSDKSGDFHLSHRERSNCEAIRVRG
jgi:hypothetical protein